MKKIKLYGFKVMAYAAAIMLAVTGAMLTSADAAQAAAPATEVTAACTHETEFITEKQAKDAYTRVAKNIFGMKVDKRKLKAEFIDATEYNPHAWWIVSSRKAQCSIDAVSGDVLMFSELSEKYKGKKITLEEYENDPAYSYEVYDDPNNPYSKLAAKIVRSKLADGRAIDEVLVSATQFVWDNDDEGFDPGAKGTIQVDVCVLMETGRCYTLSFWGTKQLELKIFSSHPTKDACLGGYFYEDQA